MGWGWRLALFVLLAKSYGSCLQPRGPHAHCVHCAIPDLARISGQRQRMNLHPSLGCSEAASRFPLEIKTYYILCSSAESTLIIVARVQRCKCFLMHKKRAQKASGNQRSRYRFNIAALQIHRESTDLSTRATLYAKRKYGPRDGARAPRQAWGCDSGGGVVGDMQAISDASPQSGAQAMRCALHGNAATWGRQSSLISRRGGPRVCSRGRVKSPRCPVSTRTFRFCSTKSPFSIALPRQPMPGSARWNSRSAMTTLSRKSRRAYLPMG